MTWTPVDGDTVTEQTHTSHEKLIDSIRGALALGLPFTVETVERPSARQRIVGYRITTRRRTP